MVQTIEGAAKSFTAHLEVIAGTDRHQTFSSIDSGRLPPAMRSGGVRVDGAITGDDLPRAMTPAFLAPESGPSARPPVPDEAVEESNSGPRTDD